MSERFVTNLVRLSFAAVAAAIVGFAPVSWAQDAAAPGENKIDLNNLVFYKGDAYSVTYEDSVSRTATSQTTVRKIAYGKSSLVNIITTTSGVYSSDALTNPHIRYPGVHVEKLPYGAGEDGDGASSPSRVAYWADTVGWVVVPVITAGSFVNIVRTDTGMIVTDGDGTCVFTKTTASC